MSPAAFIEVYLRTEGQGKPMVVVLTPGQRHETTAFERLMEQGAVYERLINRCKQFRCLAARYEKRAANYQAMRLIGMGLLWS